MQKMLKLHDFFVLDIFLFGNIGLKNNSVTLLQIYEKYNFDWHKRFYAFAFNMNLLYTYSYSWGLLCIVDKSQLRSPLLLSSYHLDFLGTILVRNFHLYLYKIESQNLDASVLIVQQSEALYIICQRIQHGIESNMGQSDHYFIHYELTSRSRTNCSLLCSKY